MEIGPSCRNHLSDNHGATPSISYHLAIHRFASSAFLPITLLCLTICTQAQPESEVLTSSLEVVAQSPYAIASRDGNMKIWSKTTWESNALTGEVTSKTNSYTELATASAHLLNGQWVDSSEQIQITETGARATNSQHKLEFLGNINSLGAIRLTLPEGDKHLISTPIGLSYFDTSSGKSVLIAELKDSLGQLLPSGNQVLYPDAFTDFSADLLYINSISGFEQLVVLRQQPPSPSEWDLDPETTVLQVITEFINPPVPQITQRKVGGMPDEHLDFGQTQMPKGYAFALDNESNAIPVTKQWLLLDGRQCLVESTPFKWLEPLLNELPAPPGQANLHNSPESVLYKVASRHLLPLRNFAKMKTPALRLASVPPTMKGVAIDYITATSQANFTFQADTTYYVRSNVTLSGTTVFEGGTVIKFTNSTSAKLSLSSFVCKTGPYRMAILTSKDDNTVGESLPGSTGSPTNYQGATFLSYGSGAYKYMRFSYAGTGLEGYPDIGDGGVWHCQFVRCATGIYGNDTDTDLYNVLFSSCGTAVNITYAGNTFRGQHVTADQVTTFFSAPDTTGKLTNSILAGVSTNGGIQTFVNCVTNSSSAGLYQTSGAASYILSDSSTNRNAGTTNINTTLANDLKSLTTYPPILLASNITTATILSPQAQRDTDVPDLGYHYAPLDYVANARGVTSTLILTNGVAIGTYGSGASYGFSLSGSGKIVSQGLPNALNYIVRYNTVQEQSTTNWSASSVGSSVLIGAYTATAQCRFTGWSIPGANGYHLYADADTNWNTFADCQFTGSVLWFTPGKVAFTNCLFERAWLNFRDHGMGSGPQLYLFNNLMSGGTLWWIQIATNLAYDNVFDRTTFTQGAPNTAFAHDYNAYVTNKTRLSPNGVHDVILTNNPVYLTSYLGTYYYPTNGGLLSTLIDAGSRYATNAALYHFCTTTNQVKEASSKVDIGFHYVAVDPATALLYDTDSDGSPDYLEDTNGNGTLDSGETNWESPWDLGLRVLITRPKNNSIIP